MEPDENMLIKTDPVHFEGSHHALNYSRYQSEYLRSIADPKTFWGEMMECIDWIQKPMQIKNTSFEPGAVSIRWYEDGVLNACYNCVDRYALEHPENLAITWVADEPQSPSKTYSYRELLVEVSRFANVLKKIGVQKGSVVTIYMPMIPEALFAMLACARIGAVHSVVFGGFSAESLAERINNCDSEYVVTAGQGRRGGKQIPLKQNVDQALKSCPGVRHTLVVDAQDLSPGDVDYRELYASVGDECPCEPMNAEDTLFILYTSGSTGVPKGLVHTTGGYLVYTHLTFELSFDYREGELYWCTADVGWITGHSYMVYGPLAFGAHVLVFEGTPTYPDASRFWQIVEKYKVNIFYTAPTAIRLLLSLGDEFVQRSDLSSLRILGTVGEPINVEAWNWYHHFIGKQRCPIVDTWWQTETGGHMITPIPYLWDLKPGKVSLPALGVTPVLLDESKSEITGPGAGNLCIKDSWPGQARTIYGNHESFMETYFSQFPYYYFTGDGADRDEDGYIRITGRMDDVLNVSGHRIGTAEIEDAFNKHPFVAETAVVGYPHSIKGEGIYAFCMLKTQYYDTDAQNLYDELVSWVRKRIGPFAKPDKIQFTKGLPRTRSGKIMRRILRKIAQNDYEDLGDTTTLTDPGIVEKLIADSRNVNL